MELKDYQQQVIQDLSAYLDEVENTNNISQAFSNFWENKGFPINSLENDHLQPYDNSITGVPRVTVKVPTAGGKTFIACNALKPIFERYPPEKPQVCVWFVPSDTILKQTYKNLKNPEHPYRQKIDSHFGNAVEVYDKEALLFGQGFNPTQVKEQLSIFVLSVQSFVETVRQGKPRAYRENENLAEFASHFKSLKSNLESVDDSALIQVIAYLNPVIIIDESHNFEADLRVDMLNNINPSFIFDLTATPRQKSNIISFVDAHKLKKNNMVKLPVIVYNHQDTNEVINSAIQMQKTLESKAKEQQAKGGKYIRPIVLFQAQPKTSDDNITFEKIKENLIDIGIPESHISIKTANKDEIKNEDLMSPECEVRYIITVNALKEGWDCPFAYVLASLANKTSSVDVEQILGRVLRLPYVKKHDDELLNYSYVFTSSNDFLGTLEKIVEGLNKSGFSAKNVRTIQKEFQEQEPTKQNTPLLGGLFGGDTPPSGEIQQASNEGDIQIDTGQVKQFSNSPEHKKKFEDIINLSKETGAEYEKQAAELEKEDNPIPTILRDQVPTFPIKEVFKDEAEKVKLPSFHIKSTPSLIEEETLVPLTKGLLLKGFELDKQDST
ncbi:MAG: DEAD/DEAH box helicase family protein, partial [Gelidibacter sp.]|nr:DEAD/DEAH box helicase family protein [Gelidibacter sp.]